MDINWASPAWLTAQRVLMTALLVMAILGIAIMLTPQDERRRGR